MPSRKPLTWPPLLLAAFLSGCQSGVGTTTGPAAEPNLIRVAAQEQEPFEAGELLAVLWQGTDAPAVAGDHNLILEGGLEDGLTFRFGLTPGQDIGLLEAELNADPRVDGVSPNYRVMDSESRQSSFAFDEGILDIEKFHDQEFLRRIGVPAAQRAADGRGVLVAVLDTGADLDHPALTGRIHPASRDFVEGDLDPSDLPDGIDNDGDLRVDEATGHGTHVAALVAMIAPRAELLILRVLDSDGRGSTYQVAEAVEYAASAGARIINMSLGVLAEPRALDEALSFADDRGVILVGAAGNWGADRPEEFPGSSLKVWAVSAADSLDRAASFTSFSRRVMISAPGTGIRSAFWNGGYAIWSGTSMAAPILSGTAALLRQLHPGWNRALIRSRIESTCDSVIPISSEQIGELGAGRINVGRAVAPPKAQPPAKLPESANFGS